MPTHENLDLKINQRNEVNSTKSQSEKKSILRETYNKPSQLGPNGKPITAEIVHTGFALSHEVINKGKAIATKEIRKRENTVPQKELPGSVEDISKEPPDKPYMQTSELFKDDSNDHMSEDEKHPIVKQFHQLDTDFNILKEGHTLIRDTMGGIGRAYIQAQSDGNGESFASDPNEHMEKITHMLTALDEMEFEDAAGNFALLHTTLRLDILSDTDFQNLDNDHSLRETLKKVVDDENNLIKLQNEFQKFKTHHNRKKDSVSNQNTLNTYFGPSQNMVIALGRSFETIEDSRYQFKQIIDKLYVTEVIVTESEEEY